MVFHKNLVYFLVLTVFAVWIAVFNIGSELSVIVCDVGQGDAILIQKGKDQILIDGGPNNRILGCLGKYMPFFDKKIEAVFLTHPDLDHYGGLIDVFKNYEVVNFFTNGGKIGSQEYQVLENMLGGHGVVTMLAKRGTIVRLGLIYLDILWPETNDQYNQDNNQSIVILLDYGNFEALFTADVEQAVSDKLSYDSKINNIEYIKVNHHGSKNGLTEKLLAKVNPKIAVISSGKGNKYGHPHKEILQMLDDSDTILFRTDEAGDIIVKTDGKKFW